MTFATMKRFFQQRLCNPDLMMSSRKQDETCLGNLPPALLEEQPFSSAKVTLTWNMIDICRGVFMASRREKRKRKKEKRKKSH